MITSQDRLEEYKKAVRLKYEVERNGDFSSFLFNPSRGKLRDLCMEIFKENNNFDDLKSFKLFFGFEYSLESLNRLRDQKDKFRPIETFFKGETDIQGIEGINIAAILVNFEPRPFSKFRHTGLNSYDSASEVEEEEEKKLKDENILVTAIVTPNDNEKNESSGKKEDKENRGLLFWIGKNKFIIIFLIIASLLGGYSISKFVFPEKQCMQWQNDHYEVVNCIDPDRSPSQNSYIPLDKDLLTFRKVTVSDTTTFFNKQGKPLYWYCKVKGKKLPDYFNSFGNGCHPETGKKLNPITHYIIKRYVLEK